MLTEAAVCEYKVVWSEATKEVKNMGLFCCENRYDCTTLGVVASLIIGVIAAFLTITAVITVTPAFLWVLLGVAIVYITVALLSVSLSRGRAYCCGSLGAALIGALGTILFSIILLGVTFAATSVIGAIFVGLLLFFFSLLISATVCYIKCVASCAD